MNASCMLQSTFNDWIGSPPHTALQVGAAFDLGCCSMAHAWCMMHAPLVLLLIPCGQHNQLRSWMCKHTRVTLDGTSTAFQKWQCRQAEQAKRTHSNCVHAEHRSVSTVTYVALPSAWRCDNMWLLIVPCAGCYSSCPVSGACIWSAAPADLLSDQFSWCGREVALKRNVAVTDVAMFQVQHLTIPYTTSVGRTSGTCSKCFAEDHARTNNYRTTGAHLTSQKVAVPSEDVVTEVSSHLGKGLRKSPDSTDDQ